MGHRLISPTFLLFFFFFGCLLILQKVNPSTPGIVPGQLQFEARGLPARHRSLTNFEETLYGKVVTPRIHYSESETQINPWPVHGRNMICLCNRSSSGEKGTCETTSSTNDLCLLMFPFTTHSQFTVRSLTQFGHRHRLIKFEQGP